MSCQWKTNWGGRRGEIKLFPQPRLVLNVGFGYDLLSKIFWKQLLKLANVVSISRKHFLYSYFKIDLSHIIAYIRKIQAIKICYDYDNNLAQSKKFKKYAKIETFFPVTPLNACFRWEIKSQPKVILQSFFQLTRRTCSPKKSLHFFISNLHVVFLMFTLSLRQVQCRDYYKHSYMKKNQNSQFRFAFSTGFRNKFSSKSNVV